MGPCTCQCKLGQYQNIGLQGIKPRSRGCSLAVLEQVIGPSDVAFDIAQFRGKLQRCDSHAPSLLCYWMDERNACARMCPGLVTEIGARMDTANGRADQAPGRETECGNPNIDGIACPEGSNND